MDFKWLKQMQKFSTVKEMDENVRAFLKEHKPKLSEGNMEVLTFIWRHSVKYPGVSFAKIDTIVKETGLSRRTVNRTITRLEKMGLLERVETTKPNGKRGCNVLLLLPQEGFFLPEDDTASDTVHDTAAINDPPRADKASPEEIEPETKDKQRIISKECKPVHNPMDVSFLPSFIPSSFITTAQSFLSVHQIEKAWQTAKLAYRKRKPSGELSDYIDLIVTTFKQSVYAYRTGKVKKEFLGYFYGGMLQVFSNRIHQEVLMDPSNVYYDWLREEEDDGKKL
ncbi:helix-turn-helix domain-containing protein [Halobacillus fulvus]|nr:helix-turn-helix domain-containing protein [Halobacillus fulvus]